MKGRDALLEVLDSEGVTHVFGNPGTTELPVIDALAARPDITYVLALQEASVVGMADGYAQATGRPAFVNLHTSAGLGNAIGNLTNAVANGTPLVVTAGQQDRRHLFTDPLLGGDLVGLARPVAKRVHEALNLTELGTVLRRAFNDAASPPTGPVFVSLPMDLLDEEGDAPVPPKSVIDRRTVPADLPQLAAILNDTEAGELAIVVADEASEAVPLTVRLAETLGCVVHAASLHSSLVFPNHHPLFAGPLPATATAMAGVLGRYRTVLAIGAHPFLVYPYSPGPAVPEHVELLHVSPDPTRLGRTHPARLALVGDPAATIEALLPLLTARPAVANDQSDLTETALGRYGPAPMHPMAAAHALLHALPPETAVVDEAITTGSYVRGFHRNTEPRRYFFARGGGLGWGMPAAVGVSLGLDGAPVLCVVGDGSAMYSPQALWTAAAHRLPVVFAVVDNRQYLILKRALDGRKDEAARSGNYVGMNLDDPPVDFVGLAQSMGVPGQRIDHADDIGDAMRAALDAGGPTLLEIPITA
ncbi:MAG: benzoylformate decarboxylase [Acidimicrobiaceae bacterium]|nr:benzoylformate decarboxylase [Acidimicrobiaceae bacterium]